MGIVNDYTVKMRSGRAMKYFGHKCSVLTPELFRREKIRLKVLLVMLYQITSSRAKISWLKLNEETEAAVTERIMKMLKSDIDSGFRVLILPLWRGDDYDESRLCGSSTNGGCEVILISQICKSCGRAWSDTGTASVIYASWMLIKSET